MTAAPLSAYAKGGPVKTLLKTPPRMPKQAPLSDPLAQAVAIRMQALLEKGAELEGLSVKRLNLPAAYAGDQRSAKAVRRAIAEKETGLQDPSRRKFMKDTAATAARQVLPKLPQAAQAASAMEKLGQLTSTDIPDSVIQQAILTAYKGLNPKFVRLVGDITAGGASMEDILPAILHKTRGAPLPEKDAWMLEELDEAELKDADLQLIADQLDALLPGAIAQRFGLPEEALTGFLMKNKLSAPGEELMRMLDDHNFWSGSFYEFSDKDKFRDTVFSDSISDKTYDYIKKGLEDEQWSTDGFESVEDWLYDALMYDSLDRVDGRYRRLLGEGVKDFQGGPLDVAGPFTEAQGYMLDNSERLHDYYTQIIDEILGGGGD